MRRLPLLLLLGLACCTDGRAERQARLAPLIGAPEAVLIQAMGVPNRTYETEGGKYLAYEETRTDYLPGSPGIPLGPPYYGMRAGGLPPQIVTFSCETTFVITGGIVKSFSFRGNACR